MEVVPITEANNSSLMAEVVNGSSVLEQSGAKGDMLVDEVKEHGEVQNARDEKAQAKGGSNKHRQVGTYKKRPRVPSAEREGVTHGLVGQKKRRLEDEQLVDVDSAKKVKVGAGDADALLSKNAAGPADRSCEEQ